MDEEKRVSFRWKKKIRVAYALTDDEQLYQEVFTEDIGENGIQILVTDRLKPKQTVKLKLEFVYDSVPIDAFGRVVYAETYGNKCRVGLEFFEMNDFDKIRLKRALDRVKQES